VNVIYSRNKVYFVVWLNLNIWQLAHCLRLLACRSRYCSDSLRVLFLRSIMSRRSSVIQRRCVVGSDADVKMVTGLLYLTVVTLIEQSGLSS